MPPKKLQPSKLLVDSFVVKAAIVVVSMLFEVVVVVVDVEGVFDVLFAETTIGVADNVCLDSGVVFVGLLGCSFEGSDVQFLSEQLAFEDAFAVVAVVVVVEGFVRASEKVVLQIIWV